MEIIMVVVLKPEMDRHKVKSFKKLKKNQTCKIKALMNFQRHESALAPKWDKQCWCKTRIFGDFTPKYLWIYTNLKQIPGDVRKSGGASAPPAPPSLAPMWKCV